MVTKRDSGDADVAMPTVGDAWRVAAGEELTDGALDWPPDLFAFTEVVLNQSEAFRFVVSPPAARSWPPNEPPDWGHAVATAAVEWVSWVQQRNGPFPKLVATEWKVIRDNADVPLEQRSSGSAWRLCEALLTLHAVSDECCAGLAGAVDAHEAGGCVYRAWGRELLARTGSLARVPPSRLRVFPKLGTPTGGISLRSVSRYACICPAGVEATWHKTPFLLPENQPSGHRANILLLPWPLRVRGSDFRPVPNSVQRPRTEPFGFFQFSPSGLTDLDVLERLIVAALEEVETVDMVALPEGAVDEMELDGLESILARHGVRTLIAGVRSHVEQQSTFPGNWVHLGVSLGDGWWHYRQSKHHRWSLDARQIDQYHLSAALHPGVRWWEAMEVPRRSVQFLELGDGITFAFLVCEDLARLDVVSELLRSVGPTLVMTVLLDGPQLASRWTARYASVLADDPGSAVLTLTSYGMVERCRPAGAPPSRVVALWKDSLRGLREIPLDQGAEAVLLTAHTAWTARHSADGRWPVENTSTVFGAGIHQVRPAAAVSQPPREGDPRSTDGLLDPVELTILISWAEAAAEALVADPDGMEALFADARGGAAWRSRLGIDEPSPQLTEAIAALCKIVPFSNTAPGGLADLASARSATATDGQEINELEWLARQVLRSAISSRRNEVLRTTSQARE